MGRFRKGFEEFMWAVSANYRKGATEGYLERFGRPHPRTPEGKRWDAAEAQHREMLKNPPPVHGAARWMSAADARAEQARFNKAMADKSRFPDMLFLGQHTEGGSSDRGIEAYSFGPGHLLTVAGTRAGKGVAHIVPNLLVAPHPMLVIDPKGENYGITARARRAFGPVFRFDPFKTTAAFDQESGFAKYNPFDFIADDGDARRLAAMLLGDAPARTEGNAFFFYSEALNVLTSLALAVARSEEPTLARLRALVAQSSQAQQADLSELARDPDPAVANTARLMLDYSEGLRTGVVAQINSATAIWDNAALQEATSSSDFDLREMKQRPMTVYVVLPFDRMEDNRAVLRMMVGQFLSAMIRDPRPARIPVMCMIDEFPALGRMDEVVRALGEVAGMNVRFWLFAQSLARLRALYGQDLPAILANCATQCFFGVSDGDTAQWLSQELGNRTIAQETQSFSSNVAAKPNEAASWLSSPHGASAGFQKGVQFFPEPLLSPQEIREVLGVGTGLAVMMQSGKPPAVIRLGRWFDDPYMAKTGRDTRSVMPALSPGPRHTEVQWGITPVRDERDSAPSA